MNKGTRPVEVPVIVGSRNDLQAVADSRLPWVLDQAGVKWEASIYSADRHYHELQAYLQLPERNVAVCYIAIAGMQNVLAGTISGIIRNTKPVIGVTLRPEELPSLTGKPRGTVVLTTGAGSHGMYNAALAAAQIVAIINGAVRDRLSRFLIANTPPAEIGVTLPPAKEGR